MYHMHQLPTNLDDTHTFNFFLVDCLAALITEGKRGKKKKKQAKAHQKRRSTLAPTHVHITCLGEHCSGEPRVSLDPRTAPFVHLAGYLP